MKDFFKYVLATVVGLVLTSIIMTIICIISMAGMIASENMSAPVKENSILRIKLQGTITERVDDNNPLSFLTDGEMQNIALDEALDGLKKAAKNKNVKGIYLEVSGLSLMPTSTTKVLTICAQQPTRYI